MLEHEERGVAPKLRDETLRRLGFAATPRPDLAGLRGLYLAWCLNVPFDNVRKMIALRREQEQPLPGGHAADFLEHWLAYGTGGTCWPSSNALCELARALGFDAWRITGSMRDLGPINHGSIAVQCDGRRWLIDTSIMYNEPIPIDAETTSRTTGAFPVEIEATAEGGHLLWVDVPPGPGFTCCRLRSQPAMHAEFLAHYETSRTRSPFNTRLYARRNRADELILLSGRTRHAKTATGVTSRELSPGELVLSLRDEIGIDQGVIDEWIRAGGLASSCRPQRVEPPPIASGVPPSQRV